MLMRLLFLSAETETTAWLVMASDFIVPVYVHIYRTGTIHGPGVAKTTWITESGLLGLEDSFGGSMNVPCIQPRRNEHHT
jgi:hypothetical protein